MPCLYEASEAVIQVDPGGVPAEADEADFNLWPPKIKKCSICMIMIQY